MIPFILFDPFDPFDPVWSLSIPSIPLIPIIFIILLLFLLYNTISFFDSIIKDHLTSRIMYYVSYLTFEDTSRLNLSHPVSDTISDGYCYDGYYSSLDMARFTVHGSVRAVTRCLSHSSIS